MILLLILHLQLKVQKCISITTEVCLGVGEKRIFSPNKIIMGTN
jgi:hypothetical protein